MLITTCTVKQALARAIQSRPDILLLDDVLSPIDYVTKSRILRLLFGRAGILHETCTTVVQVTQDREFPFTMPEIFALRIPPSDDQNTAAVAQLADVVLRMDETGVLRPYQFPSSGADKGDENGDENYDTNDETEKTRRLHVSSTTIESQSGRQKPRPKPTEITDRKVYATYFESIGLLNLVLFFGGGIIFAFSLKFPSKNTLATLPWNDYFTLKYWLT